MPQLVQVSMDIVLVLSVIIYISFAVPKLLGFLISAVLLTDIYLLVSITVLILVAIEAVNIMSLGLQLDYGAFANLLSWFLAYFIVVVRFGC